MAKYMRNEYSQTPLPNVVSGILKAHPKKVFEIAEVVDTIVVKAIPHNDRKGARNRISNILAEGARKNEWHRLIQVAIVFRISNCSSGLIFAPLQLLCR